MDKNTVTHARVLELFDYDAATGNLIWRISTSNRILVGAVVGAVSSNGRRYAGVDGVRCMAHHLVWLHQKGEWPSENVVPKNGDYLDTRIENLAAETAAETVHKSRPRSTNKSGVKGISWDSAKNSWAVHVYRDYKSVYVGRYKLLVDAIYAKNNADDGVMPTEEDKANRCIVKMANVRQRRLWHRMLRESSGAHGWASMEDFLSDVGEQPKDKRHLARINSEIPIGPQNFQWVAPEFDHTTREGRVAFGKAHRAANPELYRDRDLKRIFGISLDDYKAKLQEQNGGCAICGKPETAIRMNKLLPLAVDHNHTTGAVRGLLCTACNIGIGSLCESQVLLRSAIAYLDKWNGVESEDSVPPGT